MDTWWLLNQQFAFAFVFNVIEVIYPLLFKNRENLKDWVHFVVETEKFCSLTQEKEETKQTSLHW